MTRFKSDKYVLYQAASSNILILATLTKGYKPWHVTRVFAIITPPCVAVKPQKKLLTTTVCAPYRLNCRAVLLAEVMRSFHLKRETVGRGRGREHELSGDPSKGRY